MTSEKNRRDCSRLLDCVCEQAFLSATKKNAKESKKEKSLSSIVRSDSFFEEIEKMVKSIDSQWLSMLDANFPKLTKSYRKLALLLFMRFSPEAIAFLTSRTSPQAVSTAKSRLKTLLQTSNPSSFEAVWPLLT